MSSQASGSGFTPSHHHVFNHTQGYASKRVRTLTPHRVMDPLYFVTASKWKHMQKHPEFDFIVIGSGFTGLAFVEQIYRDRPFARILMLEQGSFWLPIHLENLPLPFKDILYRRAETFPWTLSPQTREISGLDFVSSSYPFFGGRSLFWSAWSPAPTPELMRGFPQKLIETSREPLFWSRARALLNVVDAGSLDNNVFGPLHQQLKTRLAKYHKHFMPTVETIIDAPLALHSGSIILPLHKFSTPGPLLELYEKQQNATQIGEGNPFLIANNCAVLRLISDGNGLATAIETSRGIFPVRKASIVLCMGCIPSTTLLMNSFPGKIKNAGARLTGHFVTQVVARIKRSHFTPLASTPELAALYLAGKNSHGQQYHIQITAMTTPSSQRGAAEAIDNYQSLIMPLMPEQLKGLEGYILLVCGALGELAEDNPNNWVKRNDEADLTTNVTLQIMPGEKDYALWNTMDSATFQTIEAMAFSEDHETSIEYWHESEDEQEAGWTPIRPAEQERRVPGIVHEASTLWMGTDLETSVVGPDYRPHGIQNVYVTGASIFPSAGSWNPALTICGFAQDLARTLSREL